jgi:hypothetical protein
MRAIVLVAVLALAACTKTVQDRPEPITVVQEVKVPVPVPCPTLAELGPEPSYPDTDTAIKAAPNIFARTVLLAQGRLMRIKRLAEYEVAKQACR